MGSALERFDAFQQRHRWLALPLAVVKKSSDDQGGNLAALVAYYGFFSLFPLLLVFSTILGFALHDAPSTRQSVESSIQNQFPAVGSQLHFGHITGSILALVLGVATSLYAGLGVTNAAQNLMNTVWAVPHKDRPNFLASRLRGITLLVLLGVLFIVSTVITGAVSSVFGGAGAKLLGYVVSLLVNAGLFFTAFRLMTDAEVPHRDLRWGTLMATVLWTILQTVGGLYLHHVTGGGGYGIFTTVIALIIWLHLGGQVFMYAAEVNVVTSRHLWPRSYFGPPDEPADQRVLRDLAQVEERSEHQTVDVDFTPPPGDGPAHPDPEGKSID